MAQWNPQDQNWVHSNVKRSEKLLTVPFEFSNKAQSRTLILLITVWLPAAATEGLVIGPTHWLAVNLDVMGELDNF